MKWSRATWHQFVLFASKRGLRLPGLDSARNSLSAEERSALDRHMLVREIKGARVLLGRGPLGWRRALRLFFSFFFRYRGVVGMLLKVTAGALVVLLPVALFIVLRGVLPVPSRVPFANPSLTLPRVAVSKTLYPYTSTQSLPWNSPSTINFLTSERGRGVHLTLDSDARMHPGLMRFSIGHYPSLVKEFRGFLVAEGADVTVSRKQDVAVEVLGKNRLAIWSYLLPTAYENTRCRLEVRDTNGNLLVATESDAQRATRASRKDIASIMQERLLPSNALHSRGVDEFLVEIDTLPNSLHLHVARAGEPKESSTDLRLPEMSRLEIAKRAPAWLEGNARVRDVSSAPCVYGVGHFAYEKQRVKTEGRRGVIFVVVDGLRQSLARKEELMPALHAFARERAVWFENHFSQGNETALAMASLWTSSTVRQYLRQPMEEYLRKPVLDSEKHVAKKIREMGYNAAAIGHVSDEDTSAWDDVTVIENRHYETRTITEEAGFWLENKGDAPFFLYLHYATLRSPFRPPFENLNALAFLRSPFGLAGEEALEDGLARFWDKEFSLLLKKLDALGILQRTDVIVAGSYGNQMSPMSYGKISPAFGNEKWASRSQGVLTRDELNVPLVMAITGISGNRKISTPTAHLDLAPTLAELMGSHRHRAWKGLSLMPLISGSHAFLLEKRAWMYADGRHQATLFSAQPDGEKYTRQFSTQTLDLFARGFPWRAAGKLEPQEIFSRVNANGREDFISTPHEAVQAKWRQHFENWLEVP